MDKPKKLDREKLYKYGERSEKILYDIILTYRRDVILTDRYNHFDYILNTGDKIVYIELKTRTHLKDTFKTTFLPLSKINYYNKVKRDTDKKTFLIIIFGFPINKNDIDNTDFNYYAIQYKPDIFNNYIITNNPYDDDKNLNINIDDLKPIEYYLNVLKSV